MNNAATLVRPLTNDGNNFTGTMGPVEGGMKSKCRNVGLQRILVWSGVVFHATIGQCAVPFASGQGDGAPFLAPLVVLVALAYCLLRVVQKAVTKDPSGTTLEMPRDPNASPPVR